MNTGYEMPCLYFGTIDQVIATNSPQSTGQYQTEYLVSVVGGIYSVQQHLCVRMDAYGSFNNYEDVVLAVGDHVYVMFPRGETTTGIIMGGARWYGSPTDPALGFHLKRRFNEIEESFTKSGSYEVVSDNGPNFKLAKTKITLDDASGDSIIIDKDAKTVTINCDTWAVNVSGNAQINVQGDVQIQASGDATVDAGGNAELTAGGEATVDGTMVKLGKAAFESLVKGDTFMLLYNLHTHDIITPLPGTPTTPPIVPMTPANLSLKAFTE